MQDAANPNEEPRLEKPPVFGSWGGFYIAVIVWLGLLIVFFYLFTRYFSS